MTMNSSSNDNSTTPVPKQPYQKPAFRYEKVFVTTALTCGKIGISSASCAGNQKVS